MWQTNATREVVQALQAEETIMDREKRAREFHAWIEAYVRKEVEKQMEEVQCEQRSMAQWLAEGTNETTDADGFTAEDKRWLLDMKISTRVN